MPTAAFPLAYRLTAAYDMARRIHNTKRIKGTDLPHLLHLLDVCSTPAGSTGPGTPRRRLCPRLVEPGAQQNGFRLDHTFLSPGSPTPTARHYETRDAAGNTICGPAHARLSDPAAMIIDFPFERLELPR